jgi:hypothetical protein
MLSTARRTQDAERIRRRQGFGGQGTQKSEVRSQKSEVRSQGKYTVPVKAVKANLTGIKGIQGIKQKTLQRLSHFTLIQTSLSSPSSLLES